MKKPEKLSIFYENVSRETIQSKYRLKDYFLNLCNIITHPTLSPHTS